MRAIRDVYDRAHASLLDRVVRIGVPAAVRREVDVRRRAVHEAHHRVLPVPDVVPKAGPEEGGACDNNQLQQDLGKRARPPWLYE